MLGHAHAFVDDVAGVFVRNRIDGFAVQRFLIIGNGVVARHGQKFRRFPFGFEPIFHFHAEDAVVAAVDDPIHIFFAVDFVGVRVDRAHVVPHVVFADARIDSRRF